MTNTWNGWQPHRSAALAQLEKFLPQAGRQYASRRNYDHGESLHNDVSALSPWIRYRVITEAEVVSAVLKHHSGSAAEKFIQEVFWRSYWKGWLEMRPQVWQQYQQDIRDYYSNEPPLVEESQQITLQGSGIDCFDHWCRELMNTGYLHNHARMWFASIWIYTLKLPWQLGADFFLRHLLDGDPASNTLSWRWVAGLQTVGKTYLARADNIAKYTNGRFNPIGQLATEAPALRETTAFTKTELPQSQTPDTTLKTGLLITDEDVSLHDLPTQEYASVATLNNTAGLSPGIVSPQVVSFVQQLTINCVRELQEDTSRFQLPAQSPVDLNNVATNNHDDLLAALVQWAQDNKLQQVVTSYSPTGPTAQLLADARPRLHELNIALVCLVSHWDQTVWPHASKGFFALKKKIPELLTATGVEAQQSIAF